MPDVPSQPDPLRPAVTPAATMLPYERPDEDLRASEAAAVWRVAWWIGLWWSMGTILATAPTLWTLVSGGWAESRLAELRFGVPAAVLSVLRCAGAVALVGVLLANARRRAIAILATLMSVLLLLAVISGILLGGVFFERSFHLVWLTAIVVRMLLDGGILVVAMAACWPGWMTPTRLLAAVTILLFGWPTGQIVDGLYLWLARGESAGQVLREQFSWQGWPSTLQSGLLLLVGMLLIVMSGTMRKQRWLLGVAVLVAILGITLYGLVYLCRAGDVLWTNQPFSQLLSMLANDLRCAAPVLGLLAWRPVSRA